jgi:hypothetical protein
VASVARTDLSLSNPSEEIRLAQDLVRSILIRNDLADDALMLEAVHARLDEMQLELGELAGKQQMFELLMKS